MAVRVGGIEFSIRVTTGDSVKALKRVRAALTKVIKESGEAEKQNRSFAKSANLAAGAVASFGSALAAQRLVDFAKDSALLAARVTTLGVVLDNVGRIAGLNSAQIRNLTSSVTQLGITTRQARAGLAQLAQANLDLTQATKLTRIAQDAAVIAGVNSSEAFERLIVSVQRNDVRLLRNLGIVINLNNVYNKFAQTTGRTVQSLTAFEKRNLLLNEVVERGQLIQGTYEASLADVGKQISSLDRLFEEASRSLGNQFLPVLRAGVKELTAFLKAFPRGEAFITPKTLASITAGTTAFLAFGTAVGGVATAVGVAATVLGGPVTIAIAALAGIVGGVTAAFTESALAAAQAQTEYKKLGDTAEETGQKIFEASNVIKEGIGDIGESFSGITSDTDAFRARVGDLIALFPQFADELSEIGEAGDVARLEEFFRRNLPNALKDSEQAINDLEQARTKAEERFRREVLETFREQEGVAAQTRKLEESIADTTLSNRVRQFRLREATAELTARLTRAEERFNSELAGGAEAFIIRNAELVKGNSELNKFAEVLIRARREAAGLRQAQLQATFADFTGELQNLTDAAAQALKITNQLATQQRNAFKDTGAELILNFVELQDQIRTSAIRTDEELAAARDAFRASQLENARNIRDTNQQIALGEIDDLTDRTTRLNQINQQFARDVQRIEAQASRIVEEGQESRAQIRKAEELSIKNLTEALMRQDAELQNFLDTVEFEVRGLSPRLLEIRKKLTQSIEAQRVAQLGLGQAQEKVLSQIRARQEEILAETDGDGSIAAILGTTDRQLQKLRSRLNLIQQQQDTVLKRTEAARRQAENQFDRELEKQTRKLETRERELLTRIEKVRALGQEELQEQTLQAVATRVEATKREGEELADFIKELQTDLRGQNLAAALTGDVDVFAKGTRLFRQNIRTQALPALKELAEEARSFQEQLEKANDPQQLVLLERAFKLNLRQAIVDSRTEIQSLRAELKTFQTETRPERERDQRLERQRRFNELIDAGVPAQVAQAERDRQAVKDREALNREEEELQNKIQQRRRAAKEFETEVKTLQQEFADALTAQSAAIEKQVQDQQKLVDLKKEELAVIKEQATVVAQQRSVIESAGAAGVGGTPGQIPVSPGRESRVTEAADSALAGIGDETNRIVKANEGTSENIRDLGRVIGSLSDIRESAESQQMETDQALQDLRRKLQRDKRTGDRVLRSRL